MARAKQERNGCEEKPLRNLPPFIALGAAAMVLSACGSSDDRSSEALPETVEVPAQEALEAITEEPVPDADVSSEAAEAAEADQEAPSDEAVDPPSSEETEAE